MEEKRKSVWKYLISVVSCICVEKVQEETEIVLTKEIETERSGSKSVSNALLENGTEFHT